MANSVDPDQMPHFVGSDIGLHCLQLPCFQNHLERPFYLGFYLEQNYFVLTYHILSETICLFCFCVLFTKIYPKNKFTAKNWSDQCNFYSKMTSFLGFFLFENIFTLLKFN